MSSRWGFWCSIMPSGRFINLRAKPFHDGDLLVDVLSKEGERLTLTAKNALQSKRRFAGGVLEPINFVEIFYTQARSGYLYIQEAQIIYPFTGLRSNYRNLEVAFHFLNLISKSTYEGLPDNQRLFDLLGNSLRALEETDQPLMLKLQFELKLLYYLGFLALNDDTSEFIAKPVSLHKQIDLTDDEYFYLAKTAQHHLKEINLNQLGV